MNNSDKQTLRKSGVEEIGIILQEVSLSVTELFDKVSKKMDTLQSDELMLGEASQALIEKYSNFRKEYPKFIKEIDNYRQFIQDTLVSYSETDLAIEQTVTAKLNSEITRLSDTGNIGDN